MMGADACKYLQINGNRECLAELKYRQARNTVIVLLSALAASLVVTIWAVQR